jgi:hypothetical protein
MHSYNISAPQHNISAPHLSSTSQKANNSKLGATTKVNSQVINKSRLSE